MTAELESRKGQSGIASLIIIVVILLLINWYSNSGHNFIRRMIPFGKTWTLFLFTSETPDIDYKWAQIGGYKTQQECLEKGIYEVRVNKEVTSYQCGYDCMVYPDIGEEICDRVCSKFGCRD